MCSCLYLRNKSWNSECVLSFNMDWRILVFYPEPEDSMIYFDSDMSKSTNTVVYFERKTNLYLRLRKMSHTVYAAKFEQTIIHQHVHLRQKIQSHAPVHVLMRLYPIDKSLVCFQSERRTSWVLAVVLLFVCTTFIFHSFFQNFNGTNGARPC
jgi:hypothetical protein